MKHGVAWHRGETCAQYEYRTDGSIKREEDEKSRRLIRELAKKCPNERCKWRIEKNDGCNHMTCKCCLSLTSLFIDYRFGWRD